MLTQIGITVSQHNSSQYTSEGTRKETSHGDKLIEFKSLDHPSVEDVVEELILGPQRRT